MLAATVHVRAGRPAQSAIILATTTSTQDSGLLDVLIPRFEKERGIAIKVIAVGSGAALRMAARGDPDVILADDSYFVFAFLMCALSFSFSQNISKMS